MKNELWILTVGWEPRLKVLEEKDPSMEYYLILDKNSPIEELKKDEGKFIKAFNRIRPKFPYTEFAEFIKKVKPFVIEANFNIWKDYLEWWLESLDKKESEEK